MDSKEKQGKTMDKVCVLIVDDQEEMLDLLTLVLRGEGFYPATAIDGKHALKMLQEFRPAVIITDLMMPEISGIDLIKKVRAMPDLAQVPILAMSADSTGLLPEAEKAGATEAIRKPIDLDRLVKKLREFIPHSAPMGKQT
ncbi:MAG: Regulator of RpoS [Acidobacteria bacterium]|nr:Regulator of RpoS [Acidobacteriota bacterium]